jgi:hypothetical protein
MVHDEQLKRSEAKALVEYQVRGEDSNGAAARSVAWMGEDGNRW